ncbi:MAG: hypothetical protein U7123_12260 [Potamolinea sp.]
MKIGFLTVTALLITTAFATPVKAQRICIVDNNNNVICGRPASDDDLRRYNNSSSQQSIQDVRRDVNKIYRDMFGTDADNASLRTWVRSVELGRSLDDIRKDIAQSPQARNMINQAYREVLGRDVDASGLQTYTYFLIKGKNLNDIRNDLRRSEEFKNKK